MDELIHLLKTNDGAANAFGALASAAAALLALVVSVISVVISVLTSRAQQAHNALSVRPLAEVTVGDYENSVRVKLLNNGTGPMILKAITVSDGSSAKLSLIDWMPSLPGDRSWTNFAANFHSRTLAAGAVLTLLELTESEDEEDFEQCRDLTRDALAPLTVNVEYTDIYGRTMPPVRKGMDWFAREA